MIVGKLLICVRLPGARSLKDKRHVIHGLLEKLHRRYRVAAAEVGDQGLTGNATLGIAAVSSDAKVVEATLRAVVDFIESNAEIETYDLRQELETLS